MTSGPSQLAHGLLNMTTPLPRYSVDLTSRAAQRKQRLLEIENEQRREEADALKMTKEQHETLLRSFSSVKVEFSDLDGLSWKETTRYPAFNPAMAASTHDPLPLPPSSLSPPKTPVSRNTFVALQNTDLTIFSHEDTIRPSLARPFYNNPLHRYSVHSPTSLSPSPSPSSSLRHTLSLKNLTTLTFKPKRHRLPLKGLFRKDHDKGYDSDSDSDATLCKGVTTSKRKEKKKPGMQDPVRANADTSSSANPPCLPLVIHT